MEPTNSGSISPQGGATATAQVGGWDWENAGHKTMTRVFLASPTVILVAVMFPARQWLALVWLAGLKLDVSSYALMALAGLVIASRAAETLAIGAEVSVASPSRLSVAGLRRPIS